MLAAVVVVRFTMPHLRRVELAAVVTEPLARLMRQRAQPIKVVAAVAVALTHQVSARQPQAALALSSSPCQPHSTPERQLVPQPSRRQVSTQS